MLNQTYLRVMLKNEVSLLLLLFYYNHHHNQRSRLSKLKTRISGSSYITEPVLLLFNFPPKCVSPSSIDIFRFCVNYINIRPRSKCITIYIWCKTVLVWLILNIFRLANIYLLYFYSWMWLHIIKFINIFSNNHLAKNLQTIISRWAKK